METIQEETTIKKVYGIIYKATNILDGKCYIGQTVKILEKRKREHINSALGKNNKNLMVFHKAIKKYGEVVLIIGVRKRKKKFA